MMDEYERLGAALDNRAAAKLLDPTAQAELRAALDVANALRASARTIAPSPAFHSAGRARVLAAIRIDEAVRRQSSRPVSRTQVPAANRFWNWMAPWLARACGAISAVCVTGLVTGSASATALPGDALYPVKQIREAIVLELAATDSARAQLLLERADTRLDEVVGLARVGRTDQVTEAAQRYEESLAQAAASLEGNDPTEHRSVALDAHEARVESLLATAPTPARAGVERALAALERGRERRVTRDQAASEGTTAPSSTAQPEASDSQTTVTEPTAVPRAEAETVGADGVRRERLRPAVEATRPAVPSVGKPSAPRERVAPALKPEVPPGHR